MITTDNPLHKSGRVGLSHPAPASRDGAHGLQREVLSQLNTWPVRSPGKSSGASLRAPPHDSGPLCLAKPSMYGSFIQHTIPV